VNCVGVLHHLDDPDAGLDALLSVLEPDGALGIMVYATHGRTGVYELQQMLRLIADPSDTLEQRLARARQVLAALPPTNGFRRTESLHRDHVAFGDAGIVDLLLHARDRSYSIGEIYEWLVDRHGLNVELTDVQRGRSAYEPAYTLGPENAALIDEIARLPARRRHAIAELLSGTITMHTFYATRSPDCRARYGDVDCIPFFFHEPITGPELAQLVARHREQPFLLEHRHTGVRAVVDPGRHGRRILQNIDGRRTFAQIFEAVRAEIGTDSAPSNDALFADFRALYEVLAAIDRLLLRRL
jgi:SAM-dependent methyltransferase